MPVSAFIETGRHTKIDLEIRVEIFGLDLIRFTD